MNQPMQPPAEAATQPQPKSHVGAVVLVVIGVVLTLVAIALVTAGGLLLWAYGTQRDADGFFSTPTRRFETTSYAITTEDIDLSARADDDVVDLGDIATLRLRAEAAGERSVFVGIARRGDADRYLDGVARAEVVDIRTFPFSVAYDHFGGHAPTDRPDTRDIWVASAQGTGVQTLEWRPQSGRWVVVVMNADAGAGVSVDASAGVRMLWLLPLGIGLLSGGLVLLVIGVVLLVVGVVALARHRHIELGGPEPGPGSTVVLEGRFEGAPNRALWLVKWLLLIPHYIVLAVLWIAFWVVSVIAFFAILFTARFPRALFDFNVGVLRWSWRVAYYGYGVLGTDRYPPFSLGHHPDYPATFEVAYPERLSRGLVLVKWWLLAIPQYLVLTLLLGGSTAAANDAGWSWVLSTGLIGVLVCFAALALLFAGVYPRGIYDLVMGLNRWVYRVIAYVSLMRDEYPPFRLDQGDTEPAAPAAPEQGPGPGSMPVAAPVPSMDTEPEPDPDASPE